MYPYFNRTGGFVPPDHPSQQGYYPGQPFGNYYNPYTTTQGGSLGVVDGTPPGNTNAGELTGLEPGQNDFRVVYGTSHGYDPGDRFGSFGGGLWSDLWSGIEGEKNRVHGEDLTLGQALLGGSTSRQVSDQRVYDPQDTLARSFYPYVGNILQAFGNDPSRLIAGFNPTQMAGQQYGINYASQLPSYVNQTQSQQNRLYGPTYYENVAGMTAPFSLNAFAGASQAPGGAYGDTLNDLMSGNVNLDAYDKVADSITSRMSRNFNENIVPNIRRNSLNRSGVPTSRMNIPTQQAASRFSQDLGDTLNSLYLPAYQQAQQQRQAGAGMWSDALNRQLSAAGVGFDTLGGASTLGSENINRGLSFAPQLAQLGYSPAQILQEIGGSRQGQEQQYRQAPLSLAAQIAQLLGDPTVLTRSEGKSVSQRGVSEGFSDIFGGSGSSMFGGGGMAFSDRRLKQYINKIGEYAGLPVYLFQYLWGQWAVGFMSDEVREKYPQAVTVHPSGYDMVDYGMIL